MVAAKIASMRQGERTDLASIDAKLSQEEAAELLNVGRASVQRAKVVLTEGAPTLVDAVEQGKVAVSTAADIATLSKDEQGKILASEEDILRASKEIRAKKAEGRRQERFEKFAELPELTLDGTMKYPILYVDPPWRYDYAESDNRVIENQYPTMELEDICSLPVAALATDDCVLFMWATSPKLEESFRVLNAWGFSYRTSMVWVKDKIGMGYYARQQHELLLIAKRGEPPMPNPSDRPPSVITAPRVGHSAKPEEFYLAIEQMYPEVRKLELFARNKREGWDRWGNQA
ncbi:MAG: MT-A70 family methyltransferase [Candidatus Uhrbacteria bacterium]|nr:MT-A70 family methyltransferase [Candidatus Uhrbacteria bacterium]